MKLVRPLTLALAFVAVGVPTWAAQDDPHKGHHPAGTASAAATKPVSGKTSPDTARMANQTKAMQQRPNPPDDGRQDAGRTQCVRGRTSFIWDS